MVEVEKNKHKQTYTHIQCSIWISTGRPI